MRCPCEGCSGFDKYKAEQGERGYTMMTEKRAAFEAYYLGEYLPRKRAEARGGVPDPEPGQAVAEAEAILKGMTAMTT